MTQQVTIAAIAFTIGLILGITALGVRNDGRMQPVPVPCTTHGTGALTAGEAAIAGPNEDGASRTIGKFPQRVAPSALTFVAGANGDPKAQRHLSTVACERLNRGHYCVELCATRGGSLAMAAVPCGVSL